jgi:protein required for attachment to host cells
MQCATSGIDLFHAMAVDRAVVKEVSMKNWLVVANAARARVLEEGAKPGTYVHRADLVHPESRQKGVELGTDRAGHVEGAGLGLAGAAYEPRTNVRDREHDHFAQEVAAMLNAGVAGGECAGLVLVASNPFLGHLKGHLSDHAQRVLLRTVPSDYTALTEAELTKRLGAG